MAVSPALPQVAAPSTTATTAKAKALAVRSSSNGTNTKEPSADTDAGPELAEQLNEETKRKYVKGWHIFKNNIVRKVGVLIPL